MNETTNASSWPWSSPSPRAAGRAEGLEEAAKLADFYAEENFRLAGDTILTDSVLHDRDVSATAWAKSEELQSDGHMHASMAHAAQHIAAAIRKVIDNPNPSTNSDQDGDRKMPTQTNELDAITLASGAGYATVSHSGQRLSPSEIRKNQLRAAALASGARYRNG